MPSRNKRRQPRPKPLSKKAKGNWTELICMAKFTSLGLSVSKPHGENDPFDLVVLNRKGKATRLQVRSSWTCLHHRGYRLQIRSRRGRALGYDVLVGYVPPHDAWYVIPASALPSGCATQVFPHTRRRRPSRSKWERYRNAWRLLTGNPADDSRSLGLTIHACAE